MLGVSMAPSSIQMVVLEGEYADGATVEEDTFDVTDADDPATATGPDQVISAILGTREGAVEAGLELSSIGVTWTDHLEAAALRDALAAHRIDNVMLVSAFLAAAALAQNVGGAMGYERTAVLLVEPDTATLAVVETSDGSIPDVYKQQIHAESYGDAAEQLSAMVAGMEKLELLPGGLFLVGSGIDVAPLKPVLQSTTFLDVSVAEEPETALARGAALASANAPLFASSTAALAYAQDPGTGAVDQYSLPEYLYVPFGLESGDDELAYSAVRDDDADSPTVVIEKLFLPEESQPKRRPVLLIGSGLAVVGISAVLALEIALAIGIRTTGTVALQPTPGQHLIVPEQAPAPAPVQASEPLAKLSQPAPVAAPQPLNPPVAAPLPAAEAATTAAVPAAEAATTAEAATAVTATEAAETTAARGRSVTATEAAEATAAGAARGGCGNVAATEAAEATAAGAARGGCGNVTAAQATRNAARRRNVTAAQTTRTTRTRRRNVATTQTTRSARTRGGHVPATRTRCRNVAATRTARSTGAALTRRGHVAARSARTRRGHVPATRTRCRNVAATRTARSTGAALTRRGHVAA
ncbi:DUF7159 family protein, partial [Mycobacterium mantenii]|uniref:DUF7159 family protein n=1 Tax=Mycobacterium mantenii TaxID=560555 RepID=UPI003D6F70BC